MRRTQSNKLGLRLHGGPRVRSRKSVFTYFVTYRICKQLLAREIVPHRAPVKPLRGYQHGMNPEDIHVSRVHAPEPKGYATASMESREEEQWQRFVDFVDRKVRWLPDYQRRIIQMRYLAPEPLPTDNQVHNLVGKGWRYYCEQKAEALRALSRQFDAIEPEE